MMRRRKGLLRAFDKQDSSAPRGHALTQGRSLPSP